MAETKAVAMVPGPVPALVLAGLGRALVRPPETDGTGEAPPPAAAIPSQVLVQLAAGWC